MICLKEKEPSKMRKFKNWIARCWIWLRYDTNSFGRKVWEKLDAQLPKAVGATCEDESRIEKFQELIKTLSFVEYYALKKYLRERYNWWEDASYGLHTGREEEICAKKTQIYSSHYNVME